MIASHQPCLTHIIYSIRILPSSSLTETIKNYSMQLSLDLYIWGRQKSDKFILRGKFFS